MKVKVWNPYKINSYDKIGQQQNESSYEQLLRVEAVGSLSSNFTVNDQAQLDSILEAVHNETDVELLYEILEA